MQLTTFKAGLKSKEFLVALTKSPPESMEEMLLKTQKYMNAEDALASIKLGANVERREISERTQKERKGK